MEIIELSLDELKPYSKNPRKNDKAIKYVANSIREFGFKVPIVIDKNNVIVTDDGVVLTFNGDSICKNKGDCNITMEISNGSGIDNSSIPLYLNNEGYISIDSDDLSKLYK